MRMYFISESGSLGTAILPASKMTILGLTTNTSGTFSAEIGWIASRDPHSTNSVNSRNGKEWGIPLLGDRLHCVTSARGEEMTCKKPHWCNELTLLLCSDL
jgi:hypothetical protein